MPMESPTLSAVAERLDALDCVICEEPVTIEEARRLGQTLKELGATSRIFRWA